MKTEIISAILCTVCLALGGCGKGNGSDPSASPGSKGEAPVQSVRRTSFEEVTTQLDPGGTLFGYLSVDQWLNDLSGRVSSLRSLVLAGKNMKEEDRKKAELSFDFFARLIQMSGLEDVAGIGMSSVQFQKELYRSKFILHHGRGKGDGFLWSLLGKEAHELTGLNLLPKNTALAIFGDLEIKAFWETLEPELKESKLPELVMLSQMWPKMFEEAVDLEWTEALNSLSGEIGVALTLDEKNTFQFPEDPNHLELPVPALMLVARMNDDVIFERIMDAVLLNTNVVISTDEGFEKAIMKVPQNLPFPVEFVIASDKDYLYLSTSTELVRNAVAVRQRQEPGLASTLEFSELAGHVALRGNQFTYVGSRLSKILLEIPQKALVPKGMSPDQVAQLLGMLGLAKPIYGFSVGARTRTGWQQVMVGNRDSSVAVMAAPLAVAGMVTGVAASASAKENAIQKAKP